MTHSNSSARGLVATARKLANVTGTPLRTHRMRKVNALLAINSILNQGEIGRATARSRVFRLW